MVLYVPSPVSPNPVFPVVTSPVVSRQQCLLHLPLRQQSHLLLSTLPWPGRHSSFKSALALESPKLFAHPVIAMEAVPACSVTAINLSLHVLLQAWRPSSSYLCFLPALSRPRVPSLCSLSTMSSWPGGLCSHNPNLHLLACSTLSLSHPLPGSVR